MDYTEAGFNPETHQNHARRIEQQYLRRQVGMLQHLRYVD